jgi:acyl-CoA synthetase (AMP-forming)/AMP-acid ligase II
MPWSSIAGLTVLHRALLIGDTLVPHAGHFDDRELVGWLERGAVNTLGLSPLMGKRLLRALGRYGAVTGLLSIGLGGGPAPATLVEELEARFGCSVTMGYGSTELGGAVAMSRPLDPLVVRSTSVGRPIASVAIRIAEPPAEDPSRPGRLLVRSPTAMMGTVRNGRLVPPDEWMDTGDLVELDDHGNLHVLGRGDGVILRGSRRIDPVQIERALERHPGVLVACVVGVPSRVPGEQDLVAYIVGDDDVDLQALRARALGELPVGLVPQRYRQIDDLPLTADGSVRRHCFDGDTWHR